MRNCAQEITGAVKYAKHSPKENVIGGFRCGFVMSACISERYSAMTFSTPSVSACIG